MSYAADTRPLPTLNIRSLMHVDSSKQFTTVAMETSFNGCKIQGLGTAKRNVTDQYNVAIGGAVALSRALRDLADEVEALAEGL